MLTKECFLSGYSSRMYISLAQTGVCMFLDMHGCNCKHKRVCSRVWACAHTCKILLLHIFVCECSLTPRMTGLFEVTSNNRTLLRRVYVCVPDCRTFVSIPRGEFWMYKFVISPQHFMVLSRFSAPPKPIRTVKGTPRHHLVHFFGFLLCFISVPPSSSSSRCPSSVVSAVPPFSPSTSFLCLPSSLPPSLHLPSFPLSSPLSLLFAVF